MTRQQEQNDREHCHNIILTYFKNCILKKKWLAWNHRYALNLKLISILKIRESHVKFEDFHVWERNAKFRVINKIVTINRNLKLEKRYYFAIKCEFFFQLVLKKFLYIVLLQSKQTFRF
jgi:hypothetical protein